jgi:hypothetical protein
VDHGSPRRPRQVSLVVPEARVGRIDRCAQRPSDSTTRQAIDSRRILMEARQDAFTDFRSVGGDPAIDPIRPCDTIR